MNFPGLARKLFFWELCLMVLQYDLFWNNFYIQIPWKHYYLQTNVTGVFVILITNFKNVKFSKFHCRVHMTEWGNNTLANSVNVVAYVLASSWLMQFHYDVHTRWTQLCVNRRFENWVIYECAFALSCNYAAEQPHKHMLVYIAPTARTGRVYWTPGSRRNFGKLKKIC